MGNCVVLDATAREGACTRRPASARHPTHADHDPTSHRDARTIRHPLSRLPAHRDAPPPAHRLSPRRHSHWGGSRRRGTEFPGPDPRWSDRRPVEAGAAQGQETAAPVRRSGSCGWRSSYVVAGTGRRRARLRLLPLPVEQGLVITVRYLRGRRQRRPLQHPRDRIGQPGRRDVPPRPSSSATRPTPGGQRSDTIKIVHVDPATGTASSLSIPRDTYVTLSGMPAEQPDWPAQNKINSAFGGGPDALIQTIDEYLRHPHQPLHRDQFLRPGGRGQRPRGDQDGLPLPGPRPGLLHRDLLQQLGTQHPHRRMPGADGSQALALSRSRYFQYYEGGQWNSDPTSDIGRIERQNLIISAALDKAKSTYNPLRLNTLLSSVVHDFSKDNGLSANDLFSLAERYHAFSGSDLQDYTLPTVGALLVGGRRRRGGPTRRRLPDDHPVPRGNRSGRSLPLPSTPPAIRSPCRRRRPLLPRRPPRPARPAPPPRPRRPPALHRSPRSTPDPADPRGFRSTVLHRCPSACWFRK